MGMMARGGGTGGGWVSFSPPWFLKPRPLSSCSTLSPLAPPLLLPLSHVAGYLSPNPPSLLRSPRLAPLLIRVDLVNNARQGAGEGCCPAWPSRHCLNPSYPFTTIDYTPSFPLPLPATPHPPPLTLPRSCTSPSSPPSTEPLLSPPRRSSPPSMSPCRTTFMD